MVAQETQTNHEDWYLGRTGKIVKIRLEMRKKSIHFLVVLIFDDQFKLDQATSSTCIQDKLESLAKEPQDNAIIPSHFILILFPFWIFKYVNDNKMFHNILHSPLGKVF